jgi:hypothetical protein
MSRKFLMAALAATCLVAFGVSSSQAATTVKSSKSNISFRTGQTAKPGGSGPAGARSLNLNSSRSNKARMGGGGGHGQTK